MSTVHLPYVDWAVEHIVTAGITDGRRIVDVGCGFGGTIDHLCRRSEACSWHDHVLAFRKRA